MSSNSESVPMNPNPGLTENETTGVVVTVVVALFLFTLITLILYVRAKHYPGRIDRHSRPHHRQLNFAPNAAPTPPLRRLPLDPTVLSSLPITAFRSQGLQPEGSGPDCAVCLSEFTGGETVRFLPECGHGFHVECIDAWFSSNSTCPLCRLPVGPTSTPSAESSSMSFDDQGCSSTTSSSGRLEQGVAVIEIPSASASTSYAAGGATQVSGAIGEIFRSTKESFGQGSY